MLLILTNSADATANYLVPILRDSQVPFLRLDTDCLTSRTSLSYRLGEPGVSIDGNWYTAKDVDNVWFRRPERLADPRFDGSTSSDPPQAMPSSRSSDRRLIPARRRRAWLRLECRVAEPILVLECGY
jgi:hypothetical protein